MALFDQQIIHEIYTKIAQQKAAISQALDEMKGGETKQQNADSPIARDAPLTQNLNLLIRIANGEKVRTEATKADAKQVEAALQQVQDALFSNAMQTRAIIPNEFWQTNIGVLLSRVRWWLSADELITISNAAALAFGENTQANRMRIVRAIDSGQLDWIPDPSVANPQQNRRVLRPQVERLGEQRRRPQ